MHSESKLGEASGAPGVTMKGNERLVERHPEQPQDLSKQLLKLALELGPLVIFFVTNSMYGIFYATGTFMVATAVSLVASRAILRKIPIMPLVTGVFVLVFGGLTLYLQDETFIKMKPTIVNTLFGFILLGCLAYNQLIWKMLLGDVFRVTDEGWRKLQFRWGCFFLVLAVLNEIVWRNVSTDTWVSFKTFGIMPLSILFGMLMVPVLQRYELVETQSGEQEE